MNNLFSYESKFMQFMLTVADYIILNLVYIACCIPIFTIGAAQAGLYSGLRVLQDKEDDSSPLKAFFRGFRSGFGSITLVWGISSLILALLGYVILVVFAMENTNFAGATVPFWMSVVAAVICIIYQSMLPLFHSRFGCTAGQLIRNVLYVILANPIQSILFALVLWAPVILLAVQYAVFLQISLDLIVMYYSVAMGFAMRLLNKSFARLTENFKQASQAE